MKTAQARQTGIAGQNQDTAVPTAERYGKIVTTLIKEGIVNGKQFEYAERVRLKLDGQRTMLQVLKDLKYVDDNQIRDVIRKNRASMKLGNLLLELGIVSEADLRRAYEIHKSSQPPKKIGQILIEQNFVGERQLLDVLSLQLGLPVVDPEFMEIDRELFSKIPAAWYNSHKLIPIRTDEDGKVVVAFADPLDRFDVEAAQQIFGTHTAPSIALENSIQEAVRRMQRMKNLDVMAEVGENSASGIVNSLIMAAVKEKASDIHIEPTKDRLRVRFRQDGVLHFYKDFPSDLIPVLTSRIKIMCNVDITEKRRHQGGRILFEYAEGQLDLRVSFYVTVHGEKIVLRLLNRQGELLSLKQIGMAPRTLEHFIEQGLELPSGVLLVTGPTGSGKTSTIYSCINQINSPQISIITAEEPVEALIDGIAQCSINPKINLTFEESLRHVVRQDPDVIVIGEIRDTFSAKIAVQAALTGHKVLTTFHTEDSVGGLLRLLNMGLEAFMISSTVVCVLAQRLLRKVCPECRVRSVPTAVDIRRLGYQSLDLTGVHFYSGKGCPHCRHTGYKGRTGVHELLIPDEAVRSAILEQRTSQEIRHLSIESTGLVTLFEDGLIKAAAGIVSLEEVFRCLPRLQKARHLKDLQRMVGM
ncbi:MAG: GspE/PulE family protein [Desulfobacterales bacterium]